MDTFKPQPIKPLSERFAEKEASDMGLMERLAQAGQDANTTQTNEQISQRFADFSKTQNQPKKLEQAPEAQDSKLILDLRKLEELALEYPTIGDEAAVLIQKRAQMSIKDLEAWVAETLEVFKKRPIEDRDLRTTQDYTYPTK